MENLKNKYQFISQDKELSDVKQLSETIKESGWLEVDTVLVNCFPEYSSIMTQHINHRLSHVNGNELFEVINLPMPYPNMNQVWDNIEQDFRNYIRYLNDWVRRYINYSNRYLFLCIDSAGSNLARTNAMIRGRVETDNYRFAVLYKEKNNILNPDFFVEEYDESQRQLAFHWENMDNSNWKNAKQEEQNQQ